MEEYKRLTKRNANGEVETVKRPKSSYIQEVYEEWDEINRELNLRLAELEDKIEAGTLVFIDEPFWSDYHDCWAVFQRTEDIVQTCYMTVKQAEDYKTEKRLKEIRNETKSIDNSDK